MGAQTKFLVGTGTVLFSLIASTTFAQQITQAQTPAQASVSPEDAVAQAIATDYAGDCATTISPSDLGKLCSKFVAQRGNMRAYLVGRTFSEFSEWVFVAQSPTGWLPSGTAPLDESASSAPPWPAV